MAVLTSNSVGTNGLVFNNNFVKVIQDIMHATANLSLTAETANAEAERAYPSFVTGMMILHGERDLVLTLTFSKTAAADVVVSLLGINYNQLVETEVYDAIMEVTNMVAGRLKTATISLGSSFQLTTPIVIVGPNHFFGPQSRPKGIVKKFTDKRFEMLAGIYFL